jgi:hypothetical protein
MADNEAVRIAESKTIEKKVMLHHTMARKKGLSNTAEVTRTGGTRTKS